MATLENSPSTAPSSRKSAPGYEDPAWDYGNPFGQVKISPVRLPWETSGLSPDTELSDARAT